MKTPPPIVVDEIRLRGEGSDVVLSGRIRAQGLELPQALWYRFSADLAPFLSVNGDPFLPPLLMVAMRHGRRLVIDGNCSAMLLGSARHIMAIFHEWAGERGDRMDAAEIVASPAVRARGAIASGVFFSGGVDSLYTLLRNLETYPEEHAQRISHLILVHGFDVGLEQTRLFDTVRSHAAEAAAALGRVLITARTNVREPLRGMSWRNYGYGPAMAGVGLAVGGLLTTVYVGSGSNVSQEASDPALDPLWSTEGLRFVHDASGVGRLDKVRLIARSPIALGLLRVCWENPEGAYNCGRCEKCLRTMVGLFLSGALELARTFPAPLDLDGVRQLVLERSNRPFWGDMLAEARSTRHDAVAASIERALARGAWGETPLGRLDNAFWRMAEPLGLTPSRFKRLDATLFRGAGARVMRRLQRHTWKKAGQMGRHVRKGQGPGPI